MTMRTLLVVLGMAWFFMGATPIRADKLVLVAGGGATSDGLAEGVRATSAKLNNPFGVDFDKAGNMVIVELTGGRIFKVDPKGQLTHIGGTGQKADAGDGGAALKAAFNGMHALAISPSTGDIFLADTWNNRIRKLDPRTGQVSAFAGSGTKGYQGDGGPALAALFGGIYCVAFSADGSTLYAVDLDNRRVRAIDMKSGKVELLAGNGQKGEPKDGMDAKAAPLVDPRAACVDRQGNVYILERSGHALRVV